MRSLPFTKLLAASLLLTAGCSAGAPSATLLTTPLNTDAPAMARAQASSQRAPEVVSQQAAPTSVAQQAPVGVPTEAAVSVEAPLPPADEAAVAEAPAFDLGLLGSEGTRRLEASGAEAQGLLDPWRPYGVGVVKKTGTTVTLAWRTDLEAKAIVYFGKSLGLNQRGYDGVMHVTKSAKVQQVTLEGLSRFRSYTFTVVGLGPLTMQFPSYPLKTRTNLF